MRSSSGLPLRVRSSTRACTIMATEKVRPAAISGQARRWRRKPSRGPRIFLASSSSGSTILRSPYGRGDFKLQTEYLRLTRKLDLVGVGRGASGAGREALHDAGRALRPGWSTASRRGSQRAFVSTWPVSPTKRSKEARTPRSTQPRRLSASVTFDPTEFSRFRVQYTRGSVPVSGDSGVVRRGLRSVSAQPRRPRRPQLLSEGRMR